MDGKKEHEVQPVRGQGLDRRRFLGGSLAAAALAGFAWMPQQQEPTTEEKWGRGIHIRFFVGGNPGYLFAAIVLKGAKQAEADLGPTIDYIFSGWDVEKMTSQLREAVAAKPDGIAMMGHPGDEALMPIIEQAYNEGILMMYQNVDLPKVRERFGGGYIGANLEPQGRALGEAAVKRFGLKAGDRAIVFGAWGQPGRFIREEGTAKALEEAGLQVERITSPPGSGSDPNLLTPLLSGAYLKNPDTKLIVYAGGQQLSTTPVYMSAIGKGPGEVLNIGFDLSPAIITAFKQGYVQLTSDQQPFLQGYLPILSLCLTKKWGFTPLSYDTGAGLVDQSNYESVAALAEQGIR